jgi:hypothetical protein
LATDAVNGSACDDAFSGEADALMRREAGEGFCRCQWISYRTRGWKYVYVKHIDAAVKQNM